jgi:hypothetical protein
MTLTPRPSNKRATLFFATWVVVLAFAFPVKADQRDAQSAAGRAQSAYWSCLAQDAGRVYLHNDMSREAFLLFVKGLCLGDAEKFRSATVAYLALKHPAENMTTHMTSADRAIFETQDEIVSSFVAKRRLDHQ